MVNRERHKSPLPYGSMNADGQTLPLVPTVNFRELQRGRAATLATILGVSRSAVSKAIRDGRIAGPGTDGLLDLRASVAAWARNTNPGRMRARALRSVQEEIGELHQRLARAETTAEELRAALASERERVRAVVFGVQDEVAMIATSLVDALSAGCADLAARHGAERLLMAVQSGAVARLIDRAMRRAGLYRLAQNRFSDGKGATCGEDRCSEPANGAADLPLPDVLFAPEWGLTRGTNDAID